MGDEDDMEDVVTGTGLVGYFLYNLVMSSPRRFTNAVVAYANYAQFGPCQKMHASFVESRMVLWCKAGTGEVTINGHVSPMEAGRYLLLPWGHAINYRASQDDPFLLAGVHLIPWHNPRHAITFDVAHNDSSPLRRAAFRKDITIPELPSLKIGWLDSNAPITHLLEYIVRLYIRAAPPAWLARQLAQQLFHELILFDRQREVHDHGVPPELERMKQYVRFNIHRPLTLRDLVEFTKLSPSTVGRMFREELHTTPVTWILQEKMERAKTLLRTRRLSVAQVGEQVGIADPYYFSKCFKKLTGHTPLAYRQRTRWL
jgi:AraC-like DNA-binding protein